MMLLVLGLLRILCVPVTGEGTSDTVDTLVESSIIVLDEVYIDDNIRHV